MISQKNIYRIIVTASAALLLASCTKSEEAAPQEPVPGQEGAVQPGAQPTVPPPPVESQNAVPSGGMAATGGMAMNTANGIQAGAASVPVTPYRTWLTLEGFVMENNGDPENPISNVRLEVTFPQGQKLELPGNGQYWTIGNGQVQEIKQTFELPWSAIQADGFQFTVQMVRKGSELLPCKFDIKQLSQFNRKYFCHTDVAWQLNQKLPENKIEKEGIEVRVFTDKNTPAKEFPKEAIAFKN